MTPLTLARQVRELLEFRRFYTDGKGGKRIPLGWAFRVWRVQIRLNRQVAYRALSFEWLSRHYRNVRTV